MNYNLVARISPVVLSLLPIVVLGIGLSFQFENLVHSVSSLGAAGALYFLFAQLGRDKGQLLEKKLFTEWGGMPSVQVLRFSNDVFDKHTKKRYHAKLSSLCPADAIVTDSTPESEADEVYKSWTTFLRGKTRNVKEYGLLYSENLSYGFRRNLLGLKPFAVTVILFCLLINNAVGAYKFGLTTIRDWSFEIHYTTVVLVGAFLFWMFVVTKSWVRIPAFAYATRLCEASDNIK